MIQPDWRLSSWSDFYTKQSTVPIFKMFTQLTNKRGFVIFLNINIPNDDSFYFLAFQITITSNSKLTVYSSF